MSNNSSFPALSPMPAASYGQYDVNYPAKTFAGNPVHATENDLRIVAMQVEKLTQEHKQMRPQPANRWTAAKTQGNQSMTPCSSVL